MEISRCSLQPCVKTDTVSICVNSSSLGCTDMFPQTGGLHNRNWSPLLQGPEVTHKALQTQALLKALAPLPTFRYPWLVATSLPCLPPPSHGLLLCVSRTRTPVIGLRSYPKLRWSHLEILSHTIKEPLLKHAHIYKGLLGLGHGYSEGALQLVYHWGRSWLLAPAHSSTVPDNSVSPGPSHSAPSYPLQ
jgi:hypothetical protein